MEALSRLFKPVDYIRIKHPAKLKYDIWIPLMLSLVGTALLYFLPKPVPIFSERGYTSIISQLLQILTGFYIASLAAIATFEKKDMDAVMPGEPVTLKIEDRAGHIKITTLTRRKFLCLMFGYLSFLSIFVYFLGTFSNLLAINAKEIFSPKWHVPLKWSFVWLYSFLVANLMTTTLLGLYYMTDRIHRTDVVLVSGGREAQNKPDDE